MWIGGGVNIQKDELIQLHMFLIQLKINLEDMVENYNPQAFLIYEKPNISPYKVHKSKDEHKLAIYELSKGIANMLRDDNTNSVFQEIYDGLDRICNRYR